MNAHCFALGTVLTVLTGLGAVAAPQAPEEEPVFPVPTASIDLVSDESATFDDLLRDFCAATGMRVVVDQATRQELGAIPLEVYGDVTLPPDELYPVVESMLYARGFMLVELGNRSPHVFKLLSSQRDGMFRTHARSVAVEDLDVYADHPAVMIETCVTLEHLDARQLSNALRSMLVDNRSQGTVALGASSLVVSGGGRHVARIVDFLQQVDEAEGAAWQRAEESEGD